MENHILEAYNKGLRIRKKDWGMSEWIKKHSNTKSINSENGYHPVGVWAFHSSPEYWEIFHEDVEPQTPKNPILEAYNAGKRVKRISWTTSWIKKHSETELINEKGHIENFHIWESILNKHEHWEIHPDDTEPETTTQPETKEEQIQKAIKLLIENNYEVYFITKTQIVL